MRKIPPTVQRSLPPFPSKKLFNKSIVTVERRRIGLERFLRGLLRTAYIQKHMFLLRPIRLDGVPTSESTLVTPAPVLSPDLEKRIKGIVEFDQEMLNKHTNTNRLNQVALSLPQIKVASPTIVSTLRAGSHRNVIPETLGDYVLHWKLADCLEPQTSLYYSSCNGRSFTIKVQYQETGTGTLQEQHGIHAAVSNNHLQNKKNKMEL